MTKKKKKFRKLKFLRGFTTTALLIIIVIFGSLSLVGGLPKSEFEEKTGEGERVIDESSIPSGSFDNLQLGTFKFKECLQTAAVTLQLDITGSMRQAIGDLKTAVHTFTGSLSDGSIIGIQAYSDRNARLEVIPVSYYRDVKDQIRPAVDALTAGGSTPSYDALNFSREVLERAVAQYPDRKFSFIFFSDGKPNVGPSDTASIAQAAAGIKNLGVTVYAIGLGDIDRETLEAVASSTDKVSATSNSKDLENIYSQIRTKLCEGS